MIDVLAGMVNGRCENRKGGKAILRDGRIGEKAGMLGRVDKERGGGMKGGMDG